MCCVLENIHVSGRQLWQGTLVLVFLMGVSLRTQIPVSGFNTRMSLVQETKSR